MKPHELLSKGLLEGYAGNSKISNVERESFQGKSSHLETSEGYIYHDEWFVPTRLGGGQELVKTQGDGITRLYGGGQPSLEKLARLGISPKEIDKYLVDKLSELGDKTRLYEDCKPVPDGDWQYTYEVLMRDPNIEEVIVASESVLYKETRVHWHPFIISPYR